MLGTMAGLVHSLHETKMATIRATAGNRRRQALNMRRVLGDGKLTEQSFKKEPHVLAGIGGVVHDC